MTVWLEHLAAQHADWRARGLERQLRVADGPTSATQTVSAVPVQGADAPPPASLRMFCSNDYLGLASHQRVIKALTDGTVRWGVGSGASHLISGHMRPHVLLEEFIERWLAPLVPGGRALTLASGYAANLALLSALAGPGLFIASEALNHASIIDGCRLARQKGARVAAYAHADVAALEALLAAADEPRKLIVTDGVFSMDGDVAPLAELLALAERHDALLIVDDAHGVGVLGAAGRGSVDAAGVAHAERLVLMGTLGKAVGVAGAFVFAHPSVVDWLMQTARPYVFSTAMPPALAHAALTSLQLIAGSQGDALRAALQARRLEFVAGMQALLREHPACGWAVFDSPTAIQPIVVGGNGATLALAQALEAAGLRVPAIRPPTVPEGSARLRVTLSAAHTAADVAALLTALAHAATATMA